jgi:hypothetical protein
MRNAEKVVCAVKGNRGNRIRSNARRAAESNETAKPSPEPARTENANVVNRGMLNRVKRAVAGQTNRAAQPYAELAVTRSVTQQPQWRTTTVTHNRRNRRQNNGSVVTG